MYTVFAGFVGYLIDQHGLESFARLWESVPERDPVIVVTGAFAPSSPTPTPTPLPDAEPKRTEPDYYGVYGKPLEVLEREWLGSLGE